MYKYMYINIEINTCLQIHTHTPSQTFSLEVVCDKTTSQRPIIVGETNADCRKAALYILLYSLCLSLWLFAVSSEASTIASRWLLVDFRLMIVEFWLLVVFSDFVDLAGSYCCCWFPSKPRGEIILRTLVISYQIYTLANVYIYTYNNNFYKYKLLCI